IFAFLGTLANGDPENTTVVWILGILLIAGGYSMSNSIYPAYFPEQFPANVRYSGMAICLMIGLLLAGFTPAIAESLSGADHNWIAGAAFSGGCVAISGICALLSPETFRTATEKLGLKDDTTATSGHAETAGQVRSMSAEGHFGPLRAGIVGGGAIAGTHVGAYRAAEGVEATACCAIDAARARDLGVEVMSVCTPHPTHEAVVLAAAERGVHVLREKPIAIDVSSAERMVGACERAGITFGCVFQRRLWPAAQRIRAAIDDGSLGEPILVRIEVLLHRDSSYYTATPWRGTWATDGGGVLMTQAIHYVDLRQWFVGDVDWGMTAADTFAHGDHIEVEDTLAATLRLSSGAIAQFTASTALTPGLGQR